MLFQRPSGSKMLSGKNLVRGGQLDFLRVIELDQPYFSGFWLASGTMAISNASNSSG